MAIKVAASIGGQGVVEVLYPLMEQHRLPGTIRVDHGPEFTFKWLGNRPTLTAWNWTSVVQTNLLTTPSLGRSMGDFGKSA